MHFKMSFKIILMVVVITLLVMISEAFVMVRLQRQGLLENSEQVRDILLQQKEEQEKIHLAHLESKGRWAVNFIASVAPELIKVSELMRLQDYLTDLTNDEDIVYAVIYGTDGSPISLVDNTLLRQPDILEIEKTCIDEYEMEHGVLKIGLSKKNLIRAQEKTDAAIKALIVLMARETDSQIEGTVQRILLMFLVGIIVMIAVMAFFIARTITRPLAMAVEFSDGVAKGDIRREMKIVSHDEFAEMGRAMNQIPASLRIMLREVDKCTTDIICGKFGSRGDVSQLDGAFADLLTGVNRLADILVGQIDALPNPMLLMDLELNILYVNEVTLQLLRKERHEVIGSKCYDLLHSDDCQSVNCACRQAMDSGQRVTRECGSHPAGRDLKISYTGNPIRDTRGEIVAVLEVIDDQTAIREARQQILKVATYQEGEADKLTCALQEISGGNFKSGYLAESGDEDTSKAAEVFQNIQRDLDRMVTTLRGAASANERNNRLKRGQAELAEQIRGTRNVDELSREVIVYLAGFLESQVGALYLSDEGGDLHLVSSYAYTSRKSLPSTIHPGQGLVGEAALEKEVMIISDVPDDYIRIDSSLGHAAPRYLLVFPIVLQERVMGVIELGSLTPFTDLDVEFLEQNAEAIAITIHSVQAAQQTRELLSRTQQQAEELQAQQEELQAGNEELREQTEALQESESLLQQQAEELQSQQEELQVTNEQLAERTQNLEQQQEEIRRKNEELARQRNELLRKTQDLMTTNRYKSEFLANMSHELRTPLNSILILSQLFAGNKEGNLSDKQVEFARTINSSGSELLNLINEVLDLAKVEAGRMQLNIAPLDLQQFLTEMELSFAPVAAERSITMATELSNDAPPTIKTDYQKLLQIVKNLLSNALKFTEDGSVRLQISRPLPGMDLNGLAVDKSVAISIIDTGIGIAQDKQQHIFEAFQQVDGSISRQYGGTGLGLSIAKEFATLLGGEIRLTSEVGRGSTFTVLLPEVFTSRLPEDDGPKIDGGKDAAVAGQTVSPPQEKNPALGEVPEKAEDEQEVNDDRRKLAADDKILLIIEDDPAFAQVLVDLAHERGFKCIIAEDGESGLHYADYYQPGGIILDIGLPGIDGWQVMDSLKKNPKTSHIPVHFMSAADKSRQARQKGAIGFLTKPVTIEQVQDALELLEDKICSTLKKLLIVEDHHDQRSSIEALISAPHIEISGVATGNEALQLLADKSFDCMILDLGLQDMEGYKLLEMIKKDEVLSNLPVIIYTGRELSQEDEERLRQYSDSIIIKGAQSPERLLAETTLFLHQVEADLPKDKQRMLTQAHQREDIFTAKKILVVDDDMRNVFALASALEEKGMEVLAAENGGKALEMLDASPDISLVLMDIMMPEMDGYETMARIRSQPRFKNLPIIALTAKAMKGDRHKCIDAGANDYLAKPVEVGRLLSLLRVWLCQ